MCNGDGNDSFDPMFFHCISAPASSMHRSCKSEDFHGALYIVQQLVLALKHHASASDQFLSFLFHKLLLVNESLKYPI